MKKKFLKKKFFKKKNFKKEILRKKIFLYVKNKIEKDEPSVFLFLFSLFFKFSISLKNFLYEKKILKPKKIFLPIVSIGNIVAGGTGKTPFVIFLAKKIDCNLGIISRGYRSRFENKNIIVKSDQIDKFSFYEVGDEPFMIAKNIKGFLFLGKDKIKSALLAKKYVDIVFIDDGFQKRKLYKDIDIVLVQKEPFSNGFFLPRGFLRDDPKRLKDADYIVVNNVEKRENFKKALKEIRKYSDSSIIGINAYLSKICDIDYKERYPKVKKIAAFCALAHPLYFFNLLKKNNYEIVFKKEFLDHHNFSYEDLKEFVKEAKKMKAEAVFCTEKDIVKISKDFYFDLPIFFIKIDLKVTFGKENMKNLISSIYKKIYNAKKLRGCS